MSDRHAGSAQTCDMRILACVRMCVCMRVCSSRCLGEGAFVVGCYVVLQLVQPGVKLTLGSNSPPVVRAESIFSTILVTYSLAS